MYLRKEVRLAGAGAHGLAWAGMILQEAAAIYDDRNAIYDQSYGAEAQSLIARADIIICDGNIDYPKVGQLDFFLVTTPEAALRYGADTKEDTIVIVDQSVYSPALAGRKVLSFPLLSAPMLPHIVALGVLIAVSQLVTRPALEAAVKDHVPKDEESQYIHALETGLQLQAMEYPKTWQ